MGRPLSEEHEEGCSELECPVSEEMVQGAFPVVDVQLNENNKNKHGIKSQSWPCVLSVLKYPKVYVLGEVLNIGMNLKMTICLGTLSKLLSEICPNQGFLVGIHS